MIVDLIPRNPKPDVQDSAPFSLGANRQLQAGCRKSNLRETGAPAKRRCRYRFASDTGEL